MSRCRASPTATTTKTQLPVYNLLFVAFDFAFLHVILLLLSPSSSSFSLIPSDDEPRFDRTSASGHGVTNELLAFCPPATPPSRPRVAPTRAAPKSRSLSPSYSTTPSVSCGDGRSLALGLPRIKFTGDLVSYERWCSTHAVPATTSLSTIISRRCQEDEHAKHTPLQRP